MLFLAALLQHACIYIMSHSGVTLCNSLCIGCTLSGISMARTPLPTHFCVPVSLMQTPCSVTCIPVKNRHKLQATKECFIKFILYLVYENKNKIILRYNRSGETVCACLWGCRQQWVHPSSPFYCNSLTKRGKGEFEHVVFNAATCCSLHHTAPDHTLHGS